MAAAPQPTPIPDPTGLGQIDGAGLTETELVDGLRALEDLKAAASAAQARLARTLDTVVRDRHQTQGVPAARRGGDVAALVGFARRESPARGRRFLGLAHALTELPATAAAMSAGALSEWRATLIARETAVLDPDDRGVVDTWLAEPVADPTGEPGWRFEGWGDQRLVAEVRREVALLDPAAVVERRSRAEADRRVSLRPAPDAMTRLSVLLPAAQGVAVWATLTQAADQVRATGDPGQERGRKPRTRGQVMADTLVERVTGQATADAVPVTVNLVVSDRALLGGGHEPGWLEGYGPLTADHAHDLTQTALDRSALDDARAALRRLYAAPGSGALVAMESTARAFPAGLGLFLRLRDRTCRNPYCDAPVRHHDHVVDHAEGGPTTAENGQGLCEQCNHTKQAPGWRMRPAAGAPGQSAHTVEITLPTGHTTRSTAPRAPTPGRLRRTHRPRTRLDIHHPDLCIEVADDHAA